MDRAAATAVNQASAPIVAHMEDHAYPYPDWAQNLIRAFDGPYAAVASVLENANPSTYWSQSNILLSFGPFTQGVLTREVPAVPGHNISFRRDFLLAEGPLNPGDLVRESTLYDRLRARGARFLVCAEAMIKHINSSSWRSDFLVRYNGGRLYAHHRAIQNHWSFPLRLIYFLGSPLIPPLRFVRLLAEWKPQLQRLGFRIYPCFFAGLCFDAIGQAAGYLLGPGKSLAALDHYETNKRLHVTPAEAAWMDE